MFYLRRNCRGLGHPREVPWLRNLVRSHKPDAVFLCETLCNANRVEEIRRLLGFEGCLVVDRLGRSGRLALLWSKEGVCEVLNFFQNFINILIHEENQQPWRLTSFYGIADRARRRESWNMLRLLSAQSNLPWCVMGDFNDLPPNMKREVVWSILLGL